MHVRLLAKFHQANILRAAFYDLPLHGDCTRWLSLTLECIMFIFVRLNRCDIRRPV